MNANEQYHAVVCYDAHGGSNSESVDEVLHCYHSEAKATEQYITVIMFCYAIEAGRSNL